MKKAQKSGERCGGVVSGFIYTSRLRNLCTRRSGRKGTTSLDSRYARESRGMAKESAGQRPGERAAPTLRARGPRVTGGPEKRPPGHFGRRELGAGAGRRRQWRNRQPPLAPEVDASRDQRKRKQECDRVPCKERARGHAISAALYSSRQQTRLLSTDSRPLPRFLVARRWRRGINRSVKVPPANCYFRAPSGAGGQSERRRGFAWERAA